jgi:putative MATE family efflux protein
VPTESPRNSSTQTPAPGDSSGFLRDAWAAIKGTREDYTSGSLSRAITLLAIPMMLELVMESTFGLVDIYFVGKLGPNAVATVGLSASVLVILFAIALGLSMGATALVARRIGEGDPEGAGRAAGQAILAGIFFSVPPALAGVAFAPQLLGWMGAEPEVLAGSSYLAMLLAGSITIFLIFLNNAIFRGAGDAAIAMRALWLANIINMILDPCLIFGWGPFPELGLMGAAVATTIGRGIGVGYQFWVLLGGKHRVAVTPRQLRLNLPVMKGLLRVSVSGIAQFFVATASWLGVMRIIALFGSITLAGYTIALRLIMFSILISWGLANAASTLVGQSLGAGKPERAEQAVWLAGFYNTIFLTSVTVVFWLFAEPFIGFFTQDAQVISVGVEALRILSAGQIFAAYSMVTAAAFNGSGDTDTPTLINIFCYWVWQLPLAYTLARVLDFGATGVYVAVALTGITWTIIGITLFRRGRWKTRVV